MLKTAHVVRILSALLVASVSLPAFASDMSCDAVYERNLKELHHANQDNWKLFKMGVFIDPPEHALKFAGLKLLQRLGYFTVVGAEIGRFIVLETAGGVLTTVEITGLATFANDVELGEYGDAYRLIVESEEGGGPALEKFHKMLSDENPKWRIPEETFRKIVFDMNHDGMLCNDIVGDTIKEMTDYIQGLSDRAVDYWVDKANGRE